MNVKVNSEILDIPVGFNVSQLMEKLYPSKTDGKAVAIDNTVVSALNWNTTEIKENDNILIITATQGG